MAGIVRAGRSAKPLLAFDLDFVTMAALAALIVPSGGANATVVNSAGLIVPATTPRFDYSPVTLVREGLLIEPARTNSLLWSSEISNGAWGSKFNGTITANSAVAPDGTTTMDRWQRNSATGSYFGQSFVKAASAITYTASAHVKKDIGDYCHIRMQGTYPARAEVGFNLTTGAVSFPAAGISGFTGVSATIRDIGNGTWRITLTATSDAATSIGTYFTFKSNTTALDLSDSAANSAGYIWGSQTESGTAVSSYIPTTSAQVTRSADHLIMSGPSFLDRFNPAEGTFFAEIALPVGWVNATGNSRVIGANVADAPLFTNGGNGIGIFDGVTARTKTVPALAARTTKLASAYLTATSDLAVTSDGLAVTSGAGSDTLSDTTSLNLGGQTASAGKLGGHLRRVRYYRRRLPDATLQALTA